MKFSNVKNNPSIKTKKNKGFALLFSVLISSLLLTIGLSIFGIALKELAISTATRQSVHAFYAADSGRECALYWDTKVGRIPDLFSLTSGDIKCAGKSINVTGSYTPTLGYFSSLDAIVFIDIGDIDNAISVLGEGDLGSNYYIQIIKSISGRGTVEGKVFTTINSFGQDSIGGDRVQRAIYQKLNY